jgi:hypothetical protein
VVVLLVVACAEVPLDYKLEPELMVLLDALEERTLDTAEQVAAVATDTVAVAQLADPVEQSSVLLPVEVAAVVAADCMALGHKPAQVAGLGIHVGSEKQQEAEVELVVQSLPRTHQ